MPPKNEFDVRYGVMLVCLDGVKDRVNLCEFEYYVADVLDLISMRARVNLQTGFIEPNNANVNNDFGWTGGALHLLLCLDASNAEARGSFYSCKQRYGERWEVIQTECDTQNAKKIATREVVRKVIRYGC